VTRCSVVLPVSEGHAKVRRCKQRALRKLEGAPVCSGHSDAAKEGPLYVRVGKYGYTHEVGGPRVLENPGYCGACRQGEHLLCATRWDGGPCTCACEKGTGS
jgi:hypothetical protein